VETRSKARRRLNLLARSNSVTHRFLSSPCAQPITADPTAAGHELLAPVELVRTGSSQPIGLRCGTGSWKLCRWPLFEGVAWGKRAARADRGTHAGWPLSAVPVRQHVPHGRLGGLTPLSASSHQRCLDDKVGGESPVGSVTDRSPRLNDHAIASLLATDPISRNGSSAASR